jgi:hypothetical protein
VHAVESPVIALLLIGSLQQPERMFADYGKTAKVPMLWIYTENDLYSGLRYPRQWFDACVKRGAPAQGFKTANGGGK